MSGVTMSAAEESKLDGNHIVVKCSLWRHDPIIETLYVTLVQPVMLSKMRISHANTTCQNTNSEPQDPSM